ncbi:MAG: hypothetical protein EPN93_19315 [Spirochaetes bacterium]|nr:MAG: hypothetical protein EPN93_19315 [Spirochaetota bacterium]
MKKALFLLVLTAFIGTPAIFANTAINKQHSGLAKDGTKINCAYCHTTAGLEKKAGNKAQMNTNAFCLGSGCHPR